jgi:NTP pyrophosphatase (non-canonical NTP hydrolase)
MPKITKSQAPKDILCRVKIGEYDGLEGFTATRFLNKNMGRIVELVDLGHRGYFRTPMGFDVKKKYFTVLNPNSIIDEVFKDIKEEIEAARKKFPANKFMVGALTEEVGESAQAMIDHAFRKDTRQSIYKELVQVACVAIRLITEGSHEFPWQGLLRPEVRKNYATSVAIATAKANNRSE